MHQVVGNCHLDSVIFAFDNFKHSYTSQAQQDLAHGSRIDSRRGSSNLLVFRYSQDCRAPIVAVSGAYIHTESEDPLNAKDRKYI